MSAAYSPAEWHDFFLAASGAGAALAGLVFVALSINLHEIIRGEGLVSRAGEAIALLVTIVIVGLVGLAPFAEPAILGILLMLAGGIAWFTVTRARLRSRAQIGLVAEDGGHGGPTTRQWFWTLVVGEAGTIPVVLAGLSLIVGTGGGLFWLVPGIAFMVIAAMVDSWVLLVEIQR